MPRRDQKASLFGSIIGGLIATRQPRYLNQVDEDTMLDQAEHVFLAAWERFKDITAPGGPCDDD